MSTVCPRCGSHMVSAADDDGDRACVICGQRWSDISMVPDTDAPRRGRPPKAREPSHRPSPAPSLALAVVAEPASPIDQLSPREQQVLRLIVDGLMNREIADQLAVSSDTIKNHVASILEKLHARNRMQAARIAWQAGWVDGETSR